MRFHRPKPVFLGQLVRESAEPEPVFIAMKYRAENLRQSRVDVRGGLAHAMLERQVGSPAYEHVEQVGVGEGSGCKQGCEHVRHRPAFGIGCERQVDETLDRPPGRACPKLFVLGYEVLASGMTRNRDAQETQALETAVDRRLVRGVRHVK